MILTIIQARDGGERLPGKIRADICGQPMLARVVERVSQIGLPFVIAMPQPGDNENDVLSRFVRVAKHNPEADAFVRITADCPLLDVSLARFVVNLYRAGGTDFVGTHPDMDGLDVEVFSRNALLAASISANGRKAREHLTLWMRRNLSPTIVNWAPAPLRWSVDDDAGLLFVRRVYESCALCAAGVPHHTNAGSSIGGRDRVLVLDLHHMPAGDLAECAAADILRERVGGPTYVSQ